MKLIRILLFLLPVSILSAQIALPYNGRVVPQFISEKANHTAVNYKKHSIAVMIKYYKNKIEQISYIDPEGYIIKNENYVKDELHNTEYFQYNKQGHISQNKIVFVKGKNKVSYFFPKGDAPITIDYKYDQQGNVTDMTFMNYRRKQVRYVYQYAKERPELVTSVKGFIDGKLDMYGFGELNANATLSLWQEPSSGTTYTWSYEYDNKQRISKVHMKEMNGAKKVRDYFWKYEYDTKDRLIKISHKYKAEEDFQVLSEVVYNAQGLPGTRISYEPAHNEILKKILSITYNTKGLIKEETMTLDDKTKVLDTYIYLKQGEAFSIADYLTPPTSTKKADSTVSKSEQDQSQNYEVGDNIQVLWQSKWYDAKILKIKDEEFYIKYKNYSDKWNEWVKKSRMRKINSQ